MISRTQQESRHSERSLRSEESLFVAQAFLPVQFLSCSSGFTPLPSDDSLRRDIWKAAEQDGGINPPLRLRLLDSPGMHSQEWLCHARTS